MDKNEGSSKLGLALGLIVLGLILVMGKTEPNYSKDYTFEKEPVSIEGFNYNEETVEGKRPNRIVIPQLLVDLAVRKADVIDGYWEVFQDSAAWGVGSGFPGEAGNQVVFAHARKGLFLPLKNIKKGMRVYVFTGDDQERSKLSYAYEVSDIKEVLPSETEVIAPTDDETLTLYTCSGFNDTKRLIVVAKRV